jgi:Uma2 family endonuclease
MSEPARRPSYTFSDYLRIEHDAGIKHEYLDGQIYAMAGGTPEHAVLAANVITVVNVQLRGRDCRVYSSDLRVRVLATGLTTYPDVTVVCGPLERDPEDHDTATNPTLLVEVLSTSTAAYDRGEKFKHYQRIGSLREVLFVHHDARRIECWRRREGLAWRLAEDRTSGPLSLESLGCELAVEDVYRDLHLP